MEKFMRILLAIAVLVLLASCAATGENTEQDQTMTGTQPDAMTQPGITAQPEQEVYSYPYGQAPSLDSYDTFDTGGVTAAYTGGGQPGQPGQDIAGTGGGGMASADRIVYFSYDSSDILPESQAIIESNARSLAKNPQIVTQLEGHTDERGSREYNIALGERRANAVRQTMIAMGVSPQQIRVVSFGEERPAAGGHDERSYAMNRRVEIIY